MKNIMVTGVGGQGLVLITKIICEAALKAGYDVKSNDVVGLSQRGGKVWGSVRIGNKIKSPNIPPKAGDLLLAFEPLEALRWASSLKDGAKIIMNSFKVSPVSVILEKEKYPEDIKQMLEKSFDVIEVDANKIGKDIGSVKVANMVLLGLMARDLDIPKEDWIETIKENVPMKFIDLNIEAFKLGNEVL